MTKYFVVLNTLACSCFSFFFCFALFCAATAGSPDEDDSHLLFSEKGLLNIAGMISGCSSTFSRPNDRKFKMLS